VIDTSESLPTDLAAAHAMILAERAARCDVQHPQRYAATAVAQLGASSPAILPILPATTANFIFAPESSRL
jgi:hypothetical protein